MTAPQKTPDPVRTPAKKPQLLDRFVYLTLAIGAAAAAWAATNALAGAGRYNRPSHCWEVLPGEIQCGGAGVFGRRWRLLEYLDLLLPMDGIAGAWPVILMAAVVVLAAGGWALRRRMRAATGDGAARNSRRTLTEAAAVSLAGGVLGALCAYASQWVLYW